MQHGRASSAIAARSFVGRSRVMSLLMALFLFAGIGLAIPGFAARADDAIPHYALRAGDKLKVNIASNADFAAKFAETGHWGLILDHGGVTPLTRPTFERDGETVTPSDPDLWAAQSLKEWDIYAPVPDGTNNVEGVKWLPGETHWITVVFYRSDTSGVEPNPMYGTVSIYTPYTDNIDDPTPAPTADPTAVPTDDPTAPPARTDEPTAEPAPTTDPEPAPTSEPTADPAPVPAPDPVVEPATEPSAAPAPLPDDPQRRVIATTAAGDVILLDLHTAPSAKDDELVYRLLTPAMTQVVQAQNATPAQAARPAGLPDFLVGELLGGNGMDSGGGVTLTDAANQYDYTDMAAFAMQHYLGPARLISNLPATKVKNGFIGKHLLRVWQGKVQLKVLDSWLYQGQYITAVQARNTGIDPVTFDPRAIRGNFRFVATLHETLQPRGHQEDTSIWVFISDVPFNQASGGQ